MTDSNYLVCPCGSPSSHPPIEQQIRLTILPLLPAKHVLWTQIRDKLVVDADPGCPWTIGELAVRVQHVESVVSSRC